MDRNFTPRSSQGTARASGGPCTSKLERVTVPRTGRGRSTPVDASRGGRMAKPTPRADEADYVVVGSGSAGSACAGRLAESGASVILLEAGGSDNRFLVKKPGMIGPMHA